MPPHRSLVIYLIVFLLSLSGVSQGQLWSGVLAPSRAIDWSHAGAGAIPANYTQCVTSACNAVSGGTVTASSLNAAITSAPARTYIQIPAGTFTIPGQVTINNHSNVVLRGAGPDKTFLVWSATGSCTGLGAAICISNGDSNYWGGPGNTANWTAGYADGSTSITLSAATMGSIGSLAAGHLLILDQADDTSDPGNIFVCQTLGTNGSCSQQGSGGLGRPRRAQSQQVTVGSCTGANSQACSSGSATAPYTVAITPGLYAPNWRSSQSPGAWWSSNQPVTGVGIEDVSLDYRSVSTTTAGIYYSNATRNWVKNVRSLNNVIHKHIMFWQSTHNTVRDSYFYGSNPSSEGYGIDSAADSADNLIENNILQHMATQTITEGDTGTVFAYNYAVDIYFGGDWQTADGDHHSAGDSFQLWEGHEGTEFEGDTIHGSSFMVTHFRDYLQGRDPTLKPAPKTTATFAYYPAAYSRYYNLVGSVLGTQSYHSRYQNAAASSSDCGNANVSYVSVFVLGYSRQIGAKFDPCNGDAFSIPNDLLVASTLMRWGNYAACTGDAACNAVRFVAGENASGAPTHPGLANPSQTLPASFYLSSKPSWWGTIPWPAVGPDVTGGNIANVGGHASHNPAANCYLNVMGGKTDGSSGALSFNADACYSGGGGPPAPTNLVSVPH